MSCEMLNLDSVIKWYIVFVLQ